MAIYDELYVKGKRFTKYFILNDPLDQVVPKVDGVLIGFNENNELTLLLEIDGSETKILANGNVQVTGAGTSADPYKISIPNASRTIRGATTLAHPEDFPSLSTTSATSPAYVNTAIESAIEESLAQIDGSETKVEGGDNVTVLGTGIEADPYVVSVENASDNVRGVVSLATTANFPSTSNGEATTPGYVNAAINTALGALDLDGSETKIEAGTNVVVSGSGTVDDPYTISSSAAPVSATDTVQGIVSLATTANFPSTSNSEATTPGYVNAAIVGALGGFTVDGSETKVTAGANVTVSGDGTEDNPYVVNSTTGISNAQTTGHTIATIGVTPIKETITSTTNTVSGNRIATITNENNVATDINQTVTQIVVPAGQHNYRFTNEAGANTILDPAQFLSSDDGQSLTTGSDGRMFVNVISLLPEDTTFSGSNNGNVAITFEPDITDPNLVTVEGNLKVAATTPTGQSNALLHAASGFYVNQASSSLAGVTQLVPSGSHPSTSNAAATTPAYVTAAVSAGLQGLGTLTNIFANDGTTVLFKAYV